MNTKEYIESGILELYVAGVLTQDENFEVQDNANKYPEIAVEINAIESAFINYASGFASKPSTKVLENILSSIDQNNHAENLMKETKVVPMKPASKQNNLLKYLAYAAVALLFISSSLNVYYFNKYKDTREALSSLIGEKEYLAGQFSTMKTNYDIISSEMQIVKSPENVAVTMKGQSIQPDAIATVYWNKNQGAVYINVNNLPAPPPGKQYQLWALKDGKPIDAGVFTMNTSLQEMKNITAADAFAVTLEPTGGSISPSLEYLYVIGNV